MDIFYKTARVIFTWMLFVAFVHGQLGCDTQPCLHGATCIDISTEPYYRCQCLAGYSGYSCQEDVDECIFESPCRNGGLCVNRFGGYDCHCGPSWDGKQCEILVKKCAALPCLNGATCTDVGQDFYCSCSSGYAGFYCEQDINECEEVEPCSNGATCINNNGSYTCQCLPGYSGVDCESNIDECSLHSPCLNNATCKDLVNGYACLCTPGYKGVLCDEPSYECNGTPCLHGRCQETDGGSLVCVCNHGYSGDYCDVDIQECDSSPCLHGNCVDNVAGYTCFCLDGFEGDNCQINVDECVSDPCSSGSTCVDRVNGFTCLCPTGYSGVDCSEDVNECLLYSPCLNGATCVQGVGEYNCSCVKGYKGVNCSEDIDDCTDSPCINGQCVDEVGAYHCECLTGWQGQFCDLNIDDCVPDLCPNGATCIDGLDNFTCACPDGYEGELCQLDIDDCYNVTCHNGSCIDGVATYRCQCHPGYEGTYCELDINECTIDSRCANGAMCIDQVNNYTCLCADGYGGLYCDDLINPCLESPCRNGARCDQTGRDYHCVCLPGWIGRNCETEVDECEMFSPCYNNATCQDLVADYTCHCLPGYNGSRCEVDIDDCTISPCHHLSTCIDLVNAYQCLCAVGYAGDVKRQLLGCPCAGVNCTEDVDECRSNPCLNNGNCTQPSPGRYECTCPNGVTGSNCDLVNSVYVKPGGFVRSRLTHREDPLSIQFSYSAVEMSGVVLWMEGWIHSHPQLLIVKLYNQFVYVTMETGYDRVSLSQRIAGGTIRVVVGGDGIALSQPPQVFTEDARVSGTAEFLASVSHISVGAPLPWSAFLMTIVQSGDNFHGCVGNLTLNGETINFSNYSSLNRTELGCPVQVQCPLNYCSNNGSCITSWDGRHHCQCNSLFAGRQCQTQLSVECTTSQLIQVPLPTAGGMSLLSFVLSLREVWQQGVVVYTDSGNKVALVASAGNLTTYLLGVGYSLTCSLPIPSPIMLVQLQFSDYSMVLRLQDIVTSGVVECSRSSVSQLEVKGDVYIGSLSPNPVQEVWRKFIDTSDGVTGCISNLTVNGDLISFSSAIPLTADKPLTSCSRDQVCVETTPCYNGGLCTGLWDTFTCKCDEMYTGDNCSDGVAVTLDGESSALTLDLDPLIHPSVWKGSLKLRTRAVDVTVLYARYTPSFTLSLKVNTQRYLELSLLSTGSEWSVVSGAKVASGQWVDVSWNIGRRTVLTVDGDTQSKQWTDYQYIHVNASVKVVVGARLYTSDIDMLTDHLKGCISSLKFYSYLVNLLRPDSSQGITGYTHHIRSGCHSDIVCTGSSCPTNSYCVAGWNQYECLCSPGWQGVDCSNSTDDCTGVDCGHGYCEDLHLNHTCVCDYGYTGECQGEGCTVELSACDVIPCWTNQTAECIATPPLQFTCICFPGYHGDICDLDIDECDSQPCSNGASCIDLINGYECVCTEGWEGARCTIDIDDCVDEPCDNSSQCVDLFNGYTCICGPGRTGANCSLDIQECAQTPCMFDSVCVEPEPGAYECVCPEYLTGSHCEHVRTVRLMNSSFLKLPPLPERNRVTIIEFTFTTSLAEPRLVYMVMNEELYQSLTVKVDHTALYMTLHTGLYSSTVSISAPITALPYDLVTQQVLLRLLWQEGRIQMLLPPSSTVYEKDVDLGAVHLNSSVYISNMMGYTPFTKMLVVKSSPFIGCFSDYIINNQPISLLTSAAISDGIELGCEHAAMCGSNSCSNAGACTDHWTHANCTCLPGYAGLSCDVQTVAEFSSSDSLRLSSLSNLFNVRVDVASHSPAGVVFYTVPEGSSALALYINGSSVTLLTLTLGQRLTNTIEHANISQGIWCSLEVQLEPLSQILIVTCNDVALTSKVDYKQPLEFTGPLFIGSTALASAQQLWSNSLWSTNSVTACIRLITLNGRLLDLSQGVADVSSPIPGCTRDSCRLSPPSCSGNGQCVVSMDMSTRCECADGYTGASCAETEPLTFDGSTSFWSLHLHLPAVAFNGSGSFAFRTRASSGTLLHLQSQSHRLRFSMSGGELVVTTLTETQSLMRSLNDGRWYAVSWSSSPLVVTINDSLSSKTVFTGLYGAWYNDLEVRAFVGAEPSDRYYWKGCMSSLTLGDTLIPIQSLPEGVTHSRRNVVSGCHGDEQCISADICPSNAYCVDEWNSFSCLCKEGWKGPSCQASVNDCGSHRCVNGDCIDDHLSYRCQCYHGYTGVYCNERVYLCLTEQNQCNSTNTQTCIDVFPLNYTCQCKLGWTGVHCTEEINECSSSPCLNGASCVDGQNQYMCSCAEDFFGPFCENRRICSSSPCNNNATCVPSDDNSLYVCKCTEQYLGERCDIFNSCYLNECLHGSTCLSDSINRVYSCSCPTGYYGNRCELQDYCLDNRCQNGAECVNTDNKYECVCTYHYIGEFCSTVRDKCEDNSCLNGARCTFDPQTPESSYRCVCAPGYVGEMCEAEVDECTSSPCVQGECTDRVAGYTCTCHSGWHGANCQLNINECASSPCLNRGRCVDGVNGYTCTCIEGYQGLHCELDYRGCRSSPCLHAATCVPLGADNSYECVCPEGYAGMLCETNVDDCVGNLCQSSSTCVDLVQDYRCDCLPGYSGRYCTEKLDSCYASPCKNGGVCSYVGLCSCEDVNELCGFHDETCQRTRCQAMAGCSLRNTSYSCDCSSTGFTDSLCSTDIDECADGSHACRTDAMCVNEPGSYHCNCDGSGYRGDNCHIDIDECSELEDRARCNNGGTCINHPGSYTCICLDGWTGPDCTSDIQECISSPCAHNSTCIEGVNGYLCVCAGGYTGPRCSQDIDECQDEDICRNGGTCVDLIGGYQCICTSHWTGNNCDVHVEKTTPMKTSSHTETESTTISSTQANISMLTPEASIAGKNKQTALIICLTLLVVILCAAAIVLVLYRRGRLPRQAMKGSYRPDSMTTLPMSVQYKSDHRQMLI